MINLIISIVLTVVFFILLKQLFIIRVGFVQYSNYPYFAMLVVYSAMIGMLMYRGILTLKPMGIFIGSIGFVIFNSILNRVTKKIQDKADKKYIEQRTVKADNVDFEKLKELLEINNKDGIDDHNRVCNCLCKFSERQPDSSDCPIGRIEDGLDLYFSDNECLGAVLCENSRCTVFNTIIDFITFDSRDNQKGMCLIRQSKTNEELNELIMKAKGENNGKQ